MFCQVPILTHMRVFEHMVFVPKFRKFCGHAQQVCSPRRDLKQTPVAVICICFLRTNWVYDDDSRWSRSVHAIIRPLRSVTSHFTSLPISPW
jgi:hypothetical protein